MKWQVSSGLSPQCEPRKGLEKWTWHVAVVKGKDPAVKTSSTAFPLYDPEKFPNCTCLSLPICEKWLMVTVLTAGGCYERYALSTAPGTWPGYAEC